MSNGEHIYHPRNGSLEARISAYREVLDAYRNAEASLKYLDDEEWLDRLGGKESTEEAFDIGVLSLLMATEAVEPQELQEAIAEGLLEVDEAREFVQVKRKAQMQSIRERREASDAHKRSHRQT